MCAGAYSLLAIPKESSPEVIIPVGVVTTVLRGASAADVEELVTNRLEKEIINTENVEKVTSSSREGLSVITAQFEASANIDESIAALKESVDKVKNELPEDATEPSVNKINFSEQPILIFSISSDSAPAQLRALGKSLEKELEKIKGVSKVELSGVRDREFQVILRKDKLASYNVSIPQVLQAISAANSSLPVGTITVSSIDYPIKFFGSIEDIDTVSQIPISTTNGATIYLKDIATTIDGIAPPTTYSRISLDGEPSKYGISLNVYKKSGGDVTVIGEDVKAKIEELKSSLLIDSSVVVSFDAGKEVKKDLTQLFRVGIETVILVMIMLFLTIGWRESIVAGLSIPLSFVIAFIGLYASGNTINFLSLFSLILAIGILVDSGIVIAEAIHTKKDKYDGDIYKAAEDSIREYAWPLIAGTMTTVAVFAPLFFLSGVVGQFISSIPFTIIFVLIASIFVALGMVPLLAILLSDKKHTTSEVSENRLIRIQEEYFVKARNWYKDFLRKILQNSNFQNKFFNFLKISLLTSILLPVLGFLNVEFFPQEEQNAIYVSVERPQGTPLKDTDLYVRQVEEILYEEPYIESFITTVGASSVFSNNGGGQNTKLANITVNLKQEKEMTSTELIPYLESKLSVINGAFIKVEQGNNGPPSGAPIVITFKGDSLEELSLLADKGETLLNDIGGAKNIETSLKNDGAQFNIEVDRAKASQVGLNPLTVAQILRTAVSGVNATTITKQEEDIDIVVKVDLNNSFINPEDTSVATIDAIKQLPVTTNSSQVIPLGSLVSVSLGTSKNEINHDNGKRYTRITAGLEGGANAIEVVNAFQKREAELDIPSSVEVVYGGENEDVQRTFKEMGLALIVGMLGMLAILVLEFNSLRYSMYLLLTIPLSLIGVLFGLTLTGQSLSFSSMLGLVALAGVIINHAIILLDSILKRLALEKESQNFSLLEAIVESSAVRLRPIFLTTVTTVVGMIPLATVSTLWGPLAFTIMFGLAFAIILTLILIPVLFYRFPGKEYAHLTVAFENKPGIVKTACIFVWKILRAGIVIFKEYQQNR
ncbi:MAG: hypothetical protein RI935_14 [Candidatus Parcubacteria bacterium]